MPRVETVSRTYRAVMAATTPTVRWWGRLQVEGLEHLPLEGPVLVVGNHDSYWDPIAIGIAGLPRRQIRALAKSSMWDRPLMGPVLNGMGQIPIERGKGDSGALDAAITELRGGACIGIFPEGTLSRGTVLRPRSGVGRLAEAVPEARICSVRVTGTTDIIRGPRVRPRVRVQFFPPAGGDLQPGERAGDFAVRLTEEIREHAPRVKAGRGKARAA